MKSFLMTFVFAALLGHSNLASANSALVYFILGGPVDVGPIYIGASVDALSKFISDNDPEAKFTMIHNSHWREICDEIVASKKIQADEKIILTGHSYGGSASITIANCLKDAGLKVDLIVAIDPIQKPFDLPVDVVPDNIIAVNSFYQTQDPILKGNQNLHRVDEGHQGITNEFVDHIPASSSPHHELVNVLVREGVVQNLIANELKNAAK